MKTAIVVVVIVGLHCVVVGSVILMQGCGKTTSMSKREPAPQMPPVEPTLTPRLFQSHITHEQPPFSQDLKTYVVVNGDCLSNIAYRYRSTVKKIMELNGLKDPNKLSIDQKLLLPAHAELSVSASREPKLVPVATEGMEIYLVKKGDCLSNIAVRHGTTVKSLRDANKLTSDTIYVEQKLIVPRKGKTQATESLNSLIESSAEPVPEADFSAVPEVNADTTVKNEDFWDTRSAPGFNTHTVQDGESLDDVAGLYAISSRKLMEVNGLASKSITSGMILKIPRND